MAINEHYPLHPFRVKNPKTLVRVIQAFPLATLFSGTAGSASMSLIPVLVDQQGPNDLFLLGHIDRNNPQSSLLTPGNPVSVHFTGPDSYASPDLYPSDQLPGWLYVSVQGDGIIHSELSDDELTDLLVRSTSDFGSPDQSFALNPTDPRIGLYLPYILGFRILITRLQGIAKLAQDKGKADSDLAIDFIASLNHSHHQTLLDGIQEETFYDSRQHERVP